MAIKKVYDLSVDLKRARTKTNVPVLVQGDTTEFRLRLLDDGKELTAVQISGITDVELLSGFDAQNILRTTGSMDGSTAVFSIEQGALYKSGQVKAMVRLTDSTDRISTLTFEYKVIPDPTANYVPGEQDVTIFQQYIQDAQQKIDEMAATDVQVLSQQLAEKAERDEVESLADQFQEAVANVTNGEESATNSEIVAARDNEVSLGANISKKSDIQNLEADTIHGTIQTPTFNSNGMIERMRHTNKSGGIVREDIFTEHGTNMIIEERTLANGKKLTLVYRIDTTSTTALSSEKKLYKNELLYTPTTWAEWTGKGTATVVSRFLVIDNNASTINLSVPTTVEPGKKYGILFTVRANTRTANAVLHVGSGGGYPFPTTITVNPGVTGAIKSIQTANAAFSVSTAYRAAITADAGKIEIGEFRIVELPAGSQVESDFTNLPADILNKIYSWEVL